MESDNSTKYTILGCYSRKLHSIFKKFDNDGRIKSSNLRQAFNDLNLYPSHSQIQEMVHCAVEYGSPCEADHVTFGEFVVLVDELQQHYEAGSLPPPPRATIKHKTAGFVDRRNRKESLASFQVFLGGSCGSSLQPSRWRSQTAIPFLKKENITFYNPVNAWRPELVELEDKAKNAAQVHFFMIDNNTRSVVAVCEIAYLVGCGRQIIVVFTDFKSEVEEVALEKTSHREREDIMRARSVLMDIIERNGIPVFQDIDAALKCVAVHLKQAVRVEDLTVEHGALPVRFGHTLVGQALLKLRESFNSVSGESDGLISKGDVGLGYRCCTGEEFSNSWLQHLLPNQSSFTFEEFCCIVTEHKRRELSNWRLMLGHVFHPQRQSFMGNMFSKLAAPMMWLLAKLKGRDHPSQATEEVYDVYLGGSCGAANWREDIAIPLLRREAVSYLNPLVTRWSDHLIPMEAAEREKCRLLLFVITDCTRAIGAMVEAGYYIGRGCRVVLCLQKLQPDTNIAGEQMTEMAVTDYNRGRVYLIDMASREGIPVFENVQESLESVVRTVQKLDSLSNIN